MSAKLRTTLLANVTAAETAGEATPLGQSKQFCITFEWGVGTLSGVVVVETAPYKGYTGTWSNKTAFTWAAANSIDEWRGTGPFGAIRARISTVVTTTDKGVTAILEEN